MRSSCRGALLIPVDQRVGLESDAEARIYGYQLAADSVCAAASTVDQAALLRQLDSARAEADSIRREIRGPWAALPNGRYYYRSDCIAALELPGKVYFATEETAKSSGRRRSSVPGCF
ncbi:MAG: hypothetical protein ACT4P6_10650 [Gemmatimonadaceae bacterium]